MAGTTNKRSSYDSEEENVSDKKTKVEEDVIEENQVGADSQFKEETLSCVDCQASFPFTVGEQEFFAQKGFTNKPTRCAECKRAKKDRMNNRGGDRGGFGDRGGDRRGGGGGRGGGGVGGVCYANQRGECTRGDSCRFSHGGGGGGGGFGGRGGDRGYGGDRGGDRRGGGGDRGGGGGGGVCYAHQKGQCTRGDSCRFSHSG